ncbi:Histamine H2 receptor [Exaiptasia diaphana]|nr:Histamine H2 receptor [Exaiptasia diaphana]
MRAMPSSTRERAMERRVSGAIAIVIFLFVACWFPVVGYRLSQPDKSAHCSFGLIQLWFRTLCLANSSMNFIIYSLRIRQFRTAYLRIINRMLQPFRQIVRNCLSTSAEQLNTTVTPITVVSVPLTINMPSLSKESKDAKRAFANDRQSR